MRTSIWFVRHGQTKLNREQRYQGHTDAPLTDYGKRQAELLAHRLRRLPFDVALISPTGRTQATAAVLLKDRPRVRQIESPGWTEIHHGHWEGLTYHEVLARFPAEAQARFADSLHGKPATGESLHDVTERVSAAWQDILQQYNGGRVLVVTHATPIQIVLCTTFTLSPVQHWRWRVDLGSVTCLDVYETTTIVRMVNEVPRYA